MKSASLPLLSVIFTLASAPWLTAADPLTAQAAFQILKSLAGEWAGTVGSPTGNPERVQFRVTSGGSAVFERQFPDQAHEMTSVYHLDGPHLLMTHYCAAGNQPRMKLNLQASSPTELVFDHDGGTNLDPTKDGHVNSGRLRITAPDAFTAEWYFHVNGQRAGTNAFFMKRVQP